MLATLATASFAAGDAAALGENAQVFDPPAGLSEAAFGRAVALSASGDTAIVGGAAHDDRYELGGTDGNVLVFTRRANNTWAFQQELRAADRWGPPVSDTISEPTFGTAVALSGTGDTALVGGGCCDDSIPGEGLGAVYVFTRGAAGTWSFQQVLASPVSFANDWGGVISLSGDGDTAMAATALRNTVGVFVRDGSGVFSLQETLSCSEPLPNVPWYGFSLALSETGDTAILGCADDSATAGGINAGSASVFTRDATGAWSLQQQLLAADGNPYDLFGTSVALSAAGDTAIVGARGDEVGFVSGFQGWGQGSASVFTRDAAGAWTLQQQFFAPVEAEGDLGEAMGAWFGSNVALTASGDTAVVGAPQAGMIATVSGGASAGPNGIGAASVYRRDASGVWTLQENLFSPDPARIDFLTGRGPLSTGTVAIAAAGDPLLATGRGGAAVFSASAVPALGLGGLGLLAVSCLGLGLARSRRATRRQQLA